VIDAFIACVKDFAICLCLADIIHSDLFSNYLLLA